MTFKKVLIANRGEIACRIIRTLRRLSIKSVSIYAPADFGLHAELADSSFELKGESLSAYLDIPQIIKLAKENYIDAIHPGYGFLSENIHFAEACKQAKIEFIGAPIYSMQLMANKDEAKSFMAKSGIPVVPGYHDDQSEKNLSKAASDIGFPVIIKPVAGGGGKGMKTVYAAEDFPNALASAKREGQKSFANPDVLVEKFIEQPRHIEVQVFADKSGNCVHLYERDCSIQRRHQKIIEEAPAPNISEKLRKAITSAAVDAAKAVKYVGAGTVEFLVDQDESFYFMEMNTRLQVEHPVTEMITGVDLVEWQVRVAEGSKLLLKQEDITINGHAIEARIYAEEPENEFLPSTGRLNVYQPPNTNEHVRFDNGFRQGEEVTPFYDPMLAKLICHEDERAKAIETLDHSLAHFRVAGIHTNIQYLRAINNHRQFGNGHVNTRFIEDHQDDLKNDSAKRLAKAHAAVVAIHLHSSGVIKEFSHPTIAWSNSPSFNERKVNIDINKTLHTFQCAFKNQAISISKDETAHIVSEVNYVGNQFIIVFSDSSVLQAELVDSHSSAKPILFIDGIAFIYQTRSVDHFEQSYSQSGEHTLLAPITATIHSVFKKDQDTVKKGERLMILEAMKMEHVITSPFDATIKKFHFGAGERVDAQSVLIEFEH